MQFVSHMLVRCVQHLSASFSSLCSPSSPFLLPVLPLGWGGMQKRGFEEKSPKAGGREHGSQEIASAGEQTARGDLHTHLP